MTAGTDPHAGHAHAATPDRSVRPALVGDAGAIARIQCRTLESLLVDAVGESAPRIPEDTVRAQWASTLSAPRPEGCHTLVALHGLGVAGFLSCAPAPALPPQGGRTDEIPAGTEILTLAVDPDFTRSGHASRLLAALVDITGAPSLREWVTAGDEAHVRFLSSAGFAPAGLRRSLQVGSAPLVEHLWWTLGRRAAPGD